MRRARVLVLLAVVACLPVLAGCGAGKHAAYRNADGEGEYIASGGLKYQVQLSRELNPALPEDAAYLQDLGPGVAQPAKGHEWFAVWMLVQDDSPTSQMMASDFNITDSLGNLYTQVPVKPANILDYQPQVLHSKDTYPYIQTAIAQSGPRRGAVLLFQIATTAYQNRPLTMHIVAPDGENSSVSIDL